MSEAQTLILRLIIIIIILFFKFASDVLRDCVIAMLSFIIKTKVILNWVIERSHGTIK
jgi:hypothetical protein